MICLQGPSEVSCMNKAKMVHSPGMASELQGQMEKGMALLAANCGAKVPLQITERENKLVKDCRR